MKLLFDSDLILELFLNRSKYTVDAEEVWRLAKSDDNDYYITETGVQKIYSISYSFSNQEAALEIVSLIYESLTVIEIDSETLQKARLFPTIDFESSIELACADIKKIDIILTQNTCNFSKLNSSVWSVKDFLDLFSSDERTGILDDNPEKAKKNESIDSLAGKIASIEHDSTTEGSETPKKELQIPHGNVQRTVSANKLDPETKDKWRLFEIEFIELLNPYSPSSRSLFSFIRAKLKQFRLFSYYTEAYIINEAYIRAFDAVTIQNKIISSPLAWIRTTSYNLIRELNRSACRDRSKEESFLDLLIVSQSSQYVSEDEISNDIENIRIAFKELEPEEKRLLYLKVVKGLSWQEINNLMTDSNSSETVLRKRKQRALKRLRHIFHAVESSKR